MSDSEPIITPDQGYSNLIDQIYDAGHIDDQPQETNRQKIQRWANQQYENYLNDQADKGFV